MSDREMRQTAAYVRSLGKVPVKPVPGDPAHGAEIYRGKGSCAGCHSIHGEGGVAGPDLSDDRRSAQRCAICANRSSIRRRPSRRIICW